MAMNRSDLPHSAGVQVKADWERIAFNLCSEFGSDFVADKQPFAKAVVREYLHSLRPFSISASDILDRAYEAAKNAMPPEALVEVAPGELERVVKSVLEAAGYSEAMIAPPAAGVHAVPSGLVADAQVAGLRRALQNAETAFEAIRLILIKNLGEPERSAFWKAVSGRDEASRALLEAAPAAPVGGEAGYLYTWVDADGETHRFVHPSPYLTRAPEIGPRIAAPASPVGEER